MGKSVLITGITGMAGSHLAEFLLSEVKDLKIYGVKRWRSSVSNVENIKDRVTLIDCDLNDPAGTSKVINSIRPDYIFHLAAQSYVPDSWQNPHATVVANITMQLNLFEAVRQAQLDPIIHIALSSEEYGLVYPDELPINEQNPLRPLSPYAVSKVAQDMLAYQYHQTWGMKVIRTRAFNHEGPRRGHLFVTSNFAKQIAEIEAGEREPVLYVGNLSARRDWSDVRDVVRAYWLSVNHCTIGDVYVIASGTTRSVQEMVDTLLDLSKTRITVTLDPERLRPSDVEVLQGDSTKFRNATGWEPTYTFDDTLRDLLDYWREQIRPRRAVGN